MADVLTYSHGGDDDHDQLPLPPGDRSRSVSHSFFLRFTTVSFFPCHARVCGFADNEDFVSHRRQMTSVSRTWHPTVPKEKRYYGKSLRSNVLLTVSVS